MPKPASTAPIYRSNGSDRSPVVEMARSLESQLKSFYAVHAPDKIGVAQEVAEHYVGDEDLLNDLLNEKYGHCLPSRAENGQNSKEQQPALITPDPVMITQLMAPTHLKTDRIMSGYASWDTVGEAMEAAAAAVARVQTTVGGGCTGPESPKAFKSKEKPGVNPLANTLRSPSTGEEYFKLGNKIPSIERVENADPSGSPHRRTSQTPLVLDSRHLCDTRSPGKSPRTSEMERLGMLGVCDSVHSGRGALFADSKPVVAAIPRAGGGILRLEQAEAEMREFNGLVLKNGVRRPPFFSVDLDLLYMMSGPPVVAGIDFLVYADEHATNEILIEPQDLLVGIDDHDVTQANTDVIKYLLTSASRNSSVKLLLVSSKHNKVYACSVQRSRCVSDHTDWYYEAQDQFPNAVLVANVEIVNVLEDIPLKLLNSKGQLVDFLTLDDTEPGRSSLGFRVSWIASTESGRFLDSIEVLHVTPGGCADGLVQVGDYILEIEGRPLYQCNEDEIISLFRGEEIVGSACNLLVSRAGRRLNVQIKRTSNAQSSDSITLQNLVEHLEHQMDIADTTGLRETVQQIKQHAGIMEKRRSQREALVAERIKNTHSEILACITAAESHLRPPRGSTERLNTLLQTQTVSAEELVSVMNAFKGPNLKELTDFLEGIDKYKWESGEWLKLTDVVRLLEVLKDSKYVSVEQAAQALSHYGDALSMVIGQSSETIKAFALEGMEAFAAERTARLQAEKIAQKCSEKVKMLQAEVDKYAALLDRLAAETTRRHTDQASSDRPDEKGLQQGASTLASRRSRDVQAVREANQRLVQDLAEARAQTYITGSARERMLLEKNTELERRLQDSVPRKLYDDLESAVSPFLMDTAASAAPTTPGHVISPSRGAQGKPG